MLNQLKPIQAFFLILYVINFFNLRVIAQVSQSNSTTPSTTVQPGSLNSNNSRSANSSLSQVAQNQTQSNQTSINNTNSTTNATIPTNVTTTSSSRLSSLLNNDEAVPLDTKITVPFSILGVLLMVSGAPMAFWGGRNRWSSYFLTGAYVAALIVMIPILRFGVMDQDHNPSMAIQGIFVLACLISAIAGGAVAVIFWKGTRFLVGAAGGFIISVFLLSLKSNSLIPAVGLRWVVILIGITIGFILATIPSLTIHVTLFATAAMGAAAVVLGIDCFTTGGLKEFWLYIVGFGAMFPKLTYFPFTVTMQAELGVMGGLFLMGAAIQWRLLEVIKKKINQLKQLDAERKLQEEAAAYRQSMALDADLALWEKRHGDDGDSVTMTMAASPSKPYHSRKSSQFSLLPLTAPSPIVPQPKYEDTPRDHLPSIESGLGLSGCLGIVEEDSGHPDQSKIETLRTAPQTVVSLPRQFSPDQTHNQSQPHETSPSMLSINFEQSDNDRRFSRPPGAPASWTSPFSSSKPNSKNTTPLPTFNSRVTPSSPKPFHSRPLSQNPLSAQSEEELHRHARSRSTSEQLPNASSQRPERSSRIPDARSSNIETRRNSELPSRVIVGSYQQLPAARSSPPHKRESTMMTVEELDQRHRNAMKKMQLPATERIGSSSDPKQTKEQHQRHSVSSRHQVPNNRSSVFDPTHDHAARRTLSHQTGRNGPQVTNHQSTSGPSSANTHSANVQKSHSTNGWLNY